MKRGVMDNLEFVERHVTITIVDPSRYFMLLEMLTPLLKSQIDSVDRLAINKIDAVEAQGIERVFRSVRDMTKGMIPVVPISAEKEKNIPELLDGIM